MAKEARLRKVRMVEADGGTNAVLRGLDVLWALTERAESLSLKELMDATGTTRACRRRACGDRPARRHPGRR